MEYFMFNIGIEKFHVDKNFKGEFNLMRPEILYQPYAGLPKQRNESSPLKNNAQIGLKLFTRIYDASNTLCIEFISESRCLLDYDKPENEKEIFAEISEKVITEHLKLFTKKVKETGYSHGDFKVITDSAVKSVNEALIEQFRSIF